MKLYLYIICLALTCPCTVINAQEKGYFMSNGKKVEIRSFDAEIEKMMDAIGVPGVSLAIIDNNKIVYTHAYGFKQEAKKNKVNSKTVFEACSLSKGYLVYVVWKLVDEGKIDLDKPMYQYLDPGTALNHDPRYKLITPRMILSHCSGIENWKEDNDPDTLEILSNPGEKFVYSGTGYNYLADVVETIVKKPYAQYIKEMVIDSLDLKRTFVQFKRKKIGPIHTLTPSNYAIGHDEFGQEIKKWMNPDPVPSSAINVNAEDYAKLIIGIFDGNHLSRSSINHLLTPLIRTTETMDPYYYGPGFEVLRIGNDTIIGHGGSNPGFKAQILYSYVTKRGFVILTNSERGKIMTAHLNEMTAGLNIHKYFEMICPDLYPSTAITLFKIYRQDSARMFSEIEKLKNAGKLDSNTLNLLGGYFMNYNNVIAENLLNENVALFPEASLSYYLLGDLYKNAGEYRAAYKNYLKAKDMKFDLWTVDLERDLNDCQKAIREIDRRNALLVDIGDGGKSTIQAENYNEMNGIKLCATKDTGVAHSVGYIDPGDWMDYKVNISTPGIYGVNFRISSLSGGGLMELRSGDSVLAKLDITSTKGWDNWTTLTANINLPAGHQTLRIYAVSGGFNINWLQFSKASANARL
jgi:CubicO group peptidase (beta-lactamase class C family)